MNSFENLGNELHLKVDLFASLIKHISHSHQSFPFLQNAMSGNSIGKKDVPYDEDHQEGIPDQEKNDQTESPNHCWSSKESSGSNQTDISTVVNPATSVPITAPGSPDPDGSEASDDGISENEGHETG